MTTTFAALADKVDGSNEYLDAIIATGYMPSIRKGSNKLYCRAQVRYLLNGAPAPVGPAAFARMKVTLEHFRKRGRN